MLNGESLGLCVESLLNLDPLQQLPRNRLEWMCDRAQGVFVLIEGRIGITRLSEGIDMPIGQHDVPVFFGEIPILTDEPAVVTMRALTPCHLYKVNGDDLLTLLHECQNFERPSFGCFNDDHEG